MSKPTMITTMVKSDIDNKTIWEMVKHTMEKDKDEIIKKFKDLEKDLVTHLKEHHPLNYKLFMLTKLRFFINIIGLRLVVEPVEIKVLEKPILFKAVKHYKHKIYCKKTLIKEVII